MKGDLASGVIVSSAIGDSKAPEDTATIPF
jgi:hypothetical protein